MLMLTGQTARSPQVSAKLASKPSHAHATSAPSQVSVLDKVKASSSSLKQDRFNLCLLFLTLNSTKFARPTAANALSQHMLPSPFRPKTGLSPSREPSLSLKECTSPREKELLRRQSATQRKIPSALQPTATVVSAHPHLASPSQCALLPSEMAPYEHSEFCQQVCRLPREYPNIYENKSYVEAIKCISYDL
jgi:hypothetical protein